MQRIQKTISEFLSDSVVPTVSPEQAVSAAVAVMREQRCDCVVVVDGEAVVGILTERDLLNRVAAVSGRPAAIRIAEVMTAEPETLRPRDCITYALNRMAVRGFRNVPIVDDDGRLAGLLTVRDVLAHVNDVFDEVTDGSGDDKAMSEWIDIGGGG
jgi:CBS domain-containing protein